MASNCPPYRPHPFWSGYVSIEQLKYNMPPPPKWHKSTIIDVVGVCGPFVALAVIGAIVG